MFLNKLTWQSLVNVGINIVKRNGKTRSRDKQKQTNPLMFATGNVLLDDVASIHHDIEGDPDHCRGEARDAGAVATVED